MSIDGKPATENDVTNVAVNTEATSLQAENTVAANPTVEVSDEVRSYLKGLGMENVSATPELVKIAEAGLKQKSSVSRLSLEKEQLLARLSSQGMDTTVEEPVQQITSPEPVHQATNQAQTIGVSDNDLFRLSQNIHDRFQELIPAAEDGSLFKEMRQLGYFRADGINEREVYNFLSQKNSQLAELRELRQFKAEHSRLDSATNPTYMPQPGMDMNAKMSTELARQIVYTGDTSNARYGEAVRFLQDGIMRNRL